MARKPWTSSLFPFRLSFSCAWVFPNRWSSFRWMTYFKIQLKFLALTRCWPWLTGYTECTRGFKSFIVLKSLIWLYLPTVGCTLPSLLYCFAVTFSGKKGWEFMLIAQISVLIWLLSLPTAGSTCCTDLFWLMPCQACFRSTTGPTLAAIIAGGMQCPMQVRADPLVSKLFGRASCRRTPGVIDFDRCSARLNGFDALRFQLSANWTTTRKFLAPFSVAEIALSHVSTLRRPGNLIRHEQSGSNDNLVQLYKRRIFCLKRTHRRLKNGCIIHISSRWNNKKAEVIRLMRCTMQTKAKQCPDAAVWGRQHTTRQKASPVKLNRWRQPIKVPSLQFV